MGGFCDECAGECCWYVSLFLLSCVVVVLGVWDGVANVCVVGGVGSHANAMAIL